MTIRLTQALRVAGAPIAIGTELSTLPELEAEWVQRGAAVFVGEDPTVFPAYVNEINVRPGTTPGQTHARIQRALDQGGTLHIRAPGVYNVNDTLLLPSNTTLILGHGVTLRGANGMGKTVLSNEDLVNGNTNVWVYGPGLIDGNRENEGDGFYSTCDFTRLTHSGFINLAVRGGSRPTAQQNGNGEGLSMRLCVNTVVQGGRYYENDYDGISVRGCTYCALSDIFFENNDRSFVQFKSMPGNVDWARYNTAINLRGRHTTGTIGGGSPYISAVAFHTASQNVVQNVTAVGTQCFVDMLEGSDSNTVAGGFAGFRGRANRAGIYIWDFGALECFGNKIQGITFRPISHVAGAHLVFIDRATSTYIEGNIFDCTEAVGAWDFEFAADATNTRLANAFPMLNGSSITWTDAGTSNFDIWQSGSLGVGTRGDANAAGAMRGGIVMRNAAAAPTGNFANGAQIYMNGGVLTQRSSTGVVTAL